MIHTIQAWGGMSLIRVARYEGTSITHRRLRFGVVEGGKDCAGDC